MYPRNSSVFSSRRDRRETLDVQRRQQQFDRALATIQRRAGLSREEAIREAVIFASRMERDFMAQLPGQPSKGWLGAFIAQHALEFVVAGMFILGVLLSALQIMHGT